MMMEDTEAFIESIFRRSDTIRKAKSFRANIREHISALKILRRDEETVWLLEQLDRVIVGLIAECEPKLDSETPTRVDSRA